MESIKLDTHAWEELVDITSEIQRVVEQSGVSEGLCHLWCRHTTAALTVNENSDPDVKHDILLALSRIVSRDWPYLHSEGNSTAHVKSSLLNCELTLPVHAGKLAMGRWQGVMFCEFDGPRRDRQVDLIVIPTR